MTETKSVRVRSKGSGGPEKILKASRKLFFSTAFQDVSIDSIASEAKVSKSTIYKNFKDKDEILVSVISQECKRFELDDEVISEGTSSVKLIKNFGINFLKLILDPEIARFEQIVINHAMQNPKMAALFYLRAHQGAYKNLAKIIDFGKSRGEITVSDGADILAEDLICLWKHDFHARAQLGILSSNHTDLDSHVTRCIQKILCVS